MPKYLPFLFLLFIIAVVMRDDFVFTLIYLFAGAFAAGIWWSSRALGQIEHNRKFCNHIFLGEKVEIMLQFRNTGWLPVPWLKIQDDLPVGLSSSPFFSAVTSLGSKDKAAFSYVLEGSKRGLYQIGPLLISTGDILGLNKAQYAQRPNQTLTVYPKIIALRSVTIPSLSPQGTLRYHRPIFEDPTRIFSKREYVPGDSLRRVDWKATAVTGQMQVRVFEPTIALECLIVLDLNTRDYPYRSQIDSTELAIVIAASLAAWISAKKQSIGLMVNGKDPLADDGKPQSIPARKGQAHLMRILEILARAEMTETTDLSNFIQHERVRLAWGTSLIVITGQVNAALLDELYLARRAGLEVLVILAGRVGYAEDIIHRAAHFGISVLSIASERDLDMWRK